MLARYTGYKLHWYMATVEFKKGYECYLQTNAHHSETNSKKTSIYYKWLNSEIS